MHEATLREKVSRIEKGSKINIVPCNLKGGDSFTTLGTPCTSPARSSFEIRNPFVAYLENFDGEVLWLRTASYYCLKVAITELKDVDVLIGGYWEQGRT